MKDNFAPTKHDRMFVYLWHDTDDVNECKFGERWVFGGENPEKEINVRVRESLGVRKDRFDEGKCVVTAIWDVSEYAKKVNRYYKAARADDEIRGHVGFRKGNVGEVHVLDATEMELKVNEFLRQVDAPLLECGLSVWQARAGESTVDAYENGSDKVMADMCARAGKTLYAGVVIVETKAPLTIIASYVLTSFTSFKNDLAKYEQFKGLDLIDATDAKLTAKVDASLKAKRQPVVFLSMCKGGKDAKRDQRLKTLFSYDERVTLIIDEADFGSWKPGQSDVLRKVFRDDHDRLLLMTGTNSERACGPWQIDEVVQVTYLEMLMEKGVKSPTYATTLKHFEVDPKRNSLVVDVGFYQMDLIGLTDSVRKKEPELFVDDGVYLPAWQKFSKDPLRGKGFFISMLRAIFQGQGGHGELDLSMQTKVQEAHGVYMMFLPGNMKSAKADNKLNIAADIARQALLNFEVVVLSGSNGISNKKAEKLVKERVELAQKTGKNVLILSTCQAQRSFSVGEISAVFLAYDNGAVGTTIQKISRGLTPHKVGKVGRIISLSFDPNRDDKLDALILDTAKNYKKTHKLASIKDALTLVLKTVDIFNCTEDGAVKIDVDAYLETIVNQSRIARVVGQQAKVESIPDKLRQAILDNTLERYKPSTDDAQKGKTGLGGKKKGGKRTAPLSKDETKLLKEKIVAICENLDVIVHGTGKVNMSEAFAVLKKDTELGESVSEVFGMKWEAIEELTNSGAINLEFIELVHY